MRQNVVVSIIHSLVIDFFRFFFFHLPSHQISSVHGFDRVVREVEGKSFQGVETVFPRCMTSFIIVVAAIYPIDLTFVAPLVDIFLLGTVGTLGYSRKKLLPFVCSVVRGRVLDD